MADKLKHRQLIFTRKERCRVCFTCVRECPTKAIRIENGQAEVIDQRCIGCGNCVNVCSQDAKYFLDTTEHVRQLLGNGRKTIAMVAPSFPAEFMEVGDYQLFVGMLRQLGFDRVTEVAFGADLVAEEYKKRFGQGSDSPIIAANCPTVVYFIEKYHPGLVENIAPIASPMVAMARVLRKEYGEDTNIVFIGPCFSKKAESDEIDEAITFRELRDMFREDGIETGTTTASEFDPPYGGRGAIFPISRGMLQTIKVYENLFDGNVIVAEGNPGFREAIHEFEEQAIQNHHLELLACNGCVMGPGMSRHGKRFARRSAVGNFVTQKLEQMSQEEFENQVEKYKELNLSQEYEVRDRRAQTPPTDEVEKVLQRIGKKSPADYLDCGACGYTTCWDHAVAIINGHAENEMCLPFTIEKLNSYNEKLQHTNETLARMQKVLKQKEKMAGMGQLSAGIAHELNNPLGVVIMYANILLDEAGEDAPMRDDLKLIVEQADRCKKIVGGLLSFARKDQVNYGSHNMVKTIRKSINSLMVPGNIDIKVTEKLKDPMVMFDEEQMIQVFSNLVKNAMEAMPGGGKIEIRVEEKLREMHISVADNGTGIPKEDLDKIFEPFYTTKESGKGTGLGLPTIYGIIKMHKGQIKVESVADPAEGATGTRFDISIPKIIQA